MKDITGQIVKWFLAKVW